MKILNIEPKDIHVTFDMSANEIGMILDAMEHSEIKFNSDEKPELEKAATFFRDVFFKNLDAISEEIKRM
jgi:hypothetical protein